MEDHYRLTHNGIKAGVRSVLLCLLHREFLVWFLYVRLQVALWRLKLHPHTVVLCSAASIPVKNLHINLVLCWTRCLPWAAPYLYPYVLASWFSQVSILTIFRLLAEHWHLCSDCRGPGRILPIKADRRDFLAWSTLSLYSGCRRSILDAFLDLAHPVDVGLYPLPNRFHRISCMDYRLCSSHQLH